MSLDGKFSSLKFCKHSQFAREFPFPEVELKLRAQVELKYSRSSVNLRFYESLNFISLFLKSPSIIADASLLFVVHWWSSH